MTLREHVVLGGGASLALAPVLGVEGSAAFWAASVLIDVDHYWDYLTRNGFRDWSPRKMFAFHAHLFGHLHRRDFVGLNLFHTIEWLLLVAWAVAWSRSPLIFAVLWGMVFHLSLDLLRLIRYREPFRRALSVIEYWIRRRLLRQEGLDPDRVYAEALRAIGVGPGPDGVPVPVSPRA